MVGLKKFFAGQCHGSSFVVFGIDGFTNIEFICQNGAVLVVVEQTCRRIVLSDHLNIFTAGAGNGSVTVQV
ncbi:MAG: hypothetical protein ACRC1K_05445 [Planctomycetia bacterium]